MTSQISIIVPCVKNSRQLNDSITEYLKVNNLKKIFIVIEEINEDLKITNELIEYILVKKNSNMSFKRNLAAKRADSEFLAFYDSDSYPKNLNITEVAKKIFQNDKNIYAIGGPDISPANQTFYKRITSKLNKSFFLSGFRNYRKNIYNSMYVKELSSCNLIVERLKYLEMDGMDENIYSAEDTDFCNRILNKNKKLYYSSDLIAFHEDRNLKLYFIQRYVRGILTAESTIKFFIKKLKNDVISKGEYRYEYLLTPLLSLYIVLGLIFYSFFFSAFVVFIPFLLFTILIFFETFRIKKDEKFIPIFLFLYIIVIMQSFASLFAFFGLKLNIKKIYRNENDQ